MWYHNKVVVQQQVSCKKCTRCDVVVKRGNGPESVWQQKILLSYLPPGIGGCHQAASRTNIQNSENTSQINQDVRAVRPCVHKWNT